MAAVAHTVARHSGRARPRPLHGFGAFSAATDGWSGEVLNNAIVALDRYQGSVPQVHELGTDWLDMWNSSLRPLRESIPYAWQATLQGFWERYKDAYNALPASARLNAQIPFPEAVQPNDVLREQWAKLKDTSGASAAANYVAQQAAAAKQAIEQKIQAGIESLTKPATNQFLTDAQKRIAEQQAQAEATARELTNRVLIGLGLTAIAIAVMTRQRGAR